MNYKTILFAEDGIYTRVYPTFEKAVEYMVYQLGDGFDPKGVMLNSRRYDEYGRSMEIKESHDKVTPNNAESDWRYY